MLKTLKTLNAWLLQVAALQQQLEGVHAGMAELAAASRPASTQVRGGSFLICYFFNTV